MQSDQQPYPGGYRYNDSPDTPALSATLPPSAKYPKHFHGLDFQPSQLCPKNYVIFDQTDDKSRIMFHPGLTHKFNSHGFDNNATNFQNSSLNKDAYSENRESSSYMKEDTEDINALLSSDEEADDDEDEDEEVSSARTLGIYRNESFDDSSMKRQRMKEMVQTLREIVPGANQMNTAVLLDEAVRYLKSMKMEVNKLGVGNFRN
ncbi:hypothetical protein GIB67_023075 [Kingdonia uniflora]|uniref:BHLH domain-containing protein n=1 Tax=Kingdonia uniflora TaxID=39325 RepID=A0A7J7P7Z5_9MAGN|nr:hypothetical protein GIB67_023075 [Kingdonia uniflora]